MFQFFDVRSVPNSQARQYSLSLPLSLAACYGSVRCCSVLVRQGANPLLTEPPGRLNLFHCLVAVAYYEPEQEGRLCGTYEALCGMLPAGIVRGLLEGENAEGFRPLEFAVQQGMLTNRFTYFPMINFRLMAGLN